MDTCNTKDQYKGFSYFSVVAGCGGGCGCVIAALDWHSTATQLAGGSQLLVIMALTVTVLVIALLLTLTAMPNKTLTKCISTRTEYQQHEISPHSTSNQHRQPIMNAHNEPLPKQLFRLHQNVTDSTRTCESLLNKYQQATPNAEASTSPLSTSSDLISGVSSATDNNGNFVDGEVVEFGGVGQRATNQHEESQVQVPFEDVDESPEIDSEYPSLWIMVKSLPSLPSCLVKLLISHFLGWTALLSVQLFFTDYVAQTVYGGQPNSDSGNSTINLYDEGVKMGSWGLAIFAFSSSIYAGIQSYLVSQHILSMKYLHILGYIVYILCIAVISILPYVIIPAAVGSQRIHISIVLVLTVSFGVLLADIGTIPYQILADYHDNTHYNTQCNGGGKRGLGIDISLLTSMIFMSQIVVSALIGPLVDACNTNAVIMYVALVTSVLGCVWNMCVVVYHLPPSGSKPSEDQNHMVFSGNSVVCIEPDHHPLLQSPTQAQWPEPI